MTTLERYLKTLRRSRLMMYSEFRIMMTALEKYHKEIAVGIITGKRNKKELDLRPYLYDEGDSYERPFYGTLLKMLYEVATSNYIDKQSEDLKKIYNWYQANKALITSPPKIKIPTASNRSSKPNPSSSPSPSPLGEGIIADSGSGDSFEEELELKDLRKVPKLRMRPKTAPAIEKRKGVRYVTWNEAQPVRAKSSRSSHNYRSCQDNLSRSLTINPCGPAAAGKASLRRPGTAPPYVKFEQARHAKGLKPSFVLKPFKSTPAPTSSPVISSFSSPRTSPEHFSRSKSPISVHFIPKNGKEAAVNVPCQMVKKEERSPSPFSENGEHDSWKSSNEDGVTNVTDFGDVNGTLDERTLPPGVSVEDLKQIIDQQNREEELLQEQQELLQRKLLRDHDQYVKECVTQEKEQQAHVQIVNGQVSVTHDNVSHKPLHVSPVGTYDLGTSEVIQSYSEVYSPLSGAHQQSNVSGTAHFKGRSTAHHLKQSAVYQQNERSPDVINVDAILGMVTPIGIQMECDKEKQDRERINSQREFLNLVSKRPAARAPPKVIETSPSTTTNGSEVNFQPVFPKPEILEQILSQRASTELEMKGSPVEMKSREPDLNPEKSARDYTVHFRQPEKAQDGAPKNYKVSGPVAPDTIRYQWTDDGFGGKTYMKRLKTPTSPRTPRKRQPKSPAQQSKTAGSDHVTLPVGSRSLDKKTLASLMLVQRLNERKAGGSRTAPAVQPSSDKENVAYSYHLQYMTFCQPVGPRLGECDKPSSVNWYLQGEHGLYRDPGIRTVTDSDLLRSKRTEVRIPKERSLVIEGKHIGGEVTEPEVTKQALSSPSTSTIGSDQLSIDDVQVDQVITARERMTSPRTPSVSPRSSPSLLKQPVSIPTGTRSRPSSARSPRPSSARSQQPEPTFNVKQFKHFCWPDDPELMDDYKRQLEAWAAVNIQRIFRGHMAREYAYQLKLAKDERERRAAIQLQSTFRGFLTRKRLMERRMMDYRPNARNEEWSRLYKENLKKREAARHQKNQQLLIKLNKEFEKQSEQVKRVQATQNIYDVFHPTAEGPTKAQKRAAAIVIQKYFRGWFVRRMFKKVKEKALKRTLSFGKFTRNYQALIYRIQKRYGVENPTTALQFNELMEYVERLNKYEITFEKFAVNGVIPYKDIKEFLKACGHCPSQKEIDEAIAIVTKASAKGRSLTKAEAVEVLFQIYVPRGTGLKLSDVRKSTWMNPLVDGRDAMHLLSKKDLEETNLLKCFDLLTGAEAESEAIKDLLRPTSAKKSIYSNSKNSSNKNSAKNASGKGTKGRKSSKGDVLLSQYPHIRPSSPGSSRARSKR